MIASNKILIYYMQRFRSLDTSIFVDSGARLVGVAALATIQSLEYSVRILLCAKKSHLLCALSYVASMAPIHPSTLPHKWHNFRKHSY